MKNESRAILRLKMHKIRKRLYIFSIILCFAHGERVISHFVDVMEFNMKLSFLT